MQIVFNIDMFCIAINTATPTPTCNILPTYLWNKCTVDKASNDRNEMSQNENK